MTLTMAEKQTKRWKDFLNFCDECSTSNWWFGGVDDTRHQLIPKIGRGLQLNTWTDPVGKNRITTHLDREKRIFEAFCRRARLDLNSNPASDFEWLVVNADLILTHLSARSPK
jgi:hypothetical protein